VSWLHRSVNCVELLAFMTCWALMWCVIIDFFRMCLLLGMHLPPLPISGWPIIDATQSALRPIIGLYRLVSISILWWGVLHWYFLSACLTEYRSFSSPTGIRMVHFISKFFNRVHRNSIYDIVEASVCRVATNWLITIINVFSSSDQFILADTDYQQISRWLLTDNWYAPVCYRTE